MENWTSFAIAEDEPIERMAMEEFINGTLENCQVIWTAGNGAQALENIHSHPPDILIVDIEMPVMNGLKLCEILYRENFRGVVLIHTAYARFAYARRAVALNVFDYILKPMDDGEMEETLRRCVEESLSRRRANQKNENMTAIVRDVRQYALSLLTLDTSDPQQISLFFRTVGWPRDERLHTWVILFSSSTVFTPPWMKQLSGLTDWLKSQNFLLSSEYIDSRRCLVLLQPGRETDPSRLYTLVELFMIFAVRAWGQTRAWANGPFYDYLQIAAACRDVVQGGKSDSAPASSQISMTRRTWQLLRKKEAEKIKGRINRSFRDKDALQAVRHIRRILASFEDNETAAFWEIVPLLLDVISDIWPTEDFTSLFLTLFDEKTQPGQWLEQLTELIGTFPPPSTGGALEDVLSWMRANPAEEITLPKAAEKMGMDPAYFSRYFKKTVGSNFSDVLTRIRLEHCEHLLSDGRPRSLEELSAACGFSSKTYFCEVFHKWKGMTLTQYLKKINSQDMC